MDSQPVGNSNNSRNVNGSNRYSSLPIDDDLVIDKDVCINPNAIHQNSQGMSNVVNQTHNVRPTNVINKYPQNDTQVYHAPKHIPGNSSYSNITNKGKKICILTDSICSRIKIKEFNKHVNNGHAYRKAYPGGTSDEMTHYCLYTLLKDHPDTMIINAGSNDLNN